MHLNPRLALAAEMCAGARTLIDVGCDHARLSVYAVLNGAQRALACDLREKPLSRAAETARAFGLESKIELRLSDGLAAVSPGEGDTIAVCGMGGELIADILRRAPWALAGNHTLVLQPQSRERLLRRFLAENGCRIEREALALDGGKLYCVVAARGGFPPQRERNMNLFSDMLVRDPLFPDFVREQSEKCRKIIAGRERGGLDTREHRQILEMLENYADAD